MKTQDAEVLAAYFAASKLKTHFENLKKSIGNTVQHRIEDQISSTSEKIKSVGVQSLSMQRGGLYRVLFGGASALAYIEEPTNSIATFLYSVGNKKSESFKLKKKEELLEIFGIESGKKIPTAVVNNSIIDEITKRFPELHKCNLMVKESRSIVASKKKSAPSIEEAIDEVNHWMIAKKIQAIREDIELDANNPIMLFAEYNKRMKLADDLKTFLSGCISESFIDGVIPTNDFVAIETSSRINFDREILKSMVATGNKFSLVVEKEEKEKQGVEVRWCGRLDEISGGMLPQTLIDQLKNTQTPRGEKENVSKISEKVFFKPQIDRAVANRSISV